MLILGLTGQTGAGKGSVGAILETCGFVHIDGDQLSRVVTAKGTACLDELAEAFGQSILTSGGGLDRKRLGEIVFSNQNKLDLLNSIIHRYIKAETEKIIRESEKSGAKGAVIDGAALYESGIDEICDKIICVIAPKEVRLRRIMERDGIDEEKALLRMNAQKQEDYYMKKADYLINNHENILSLEKVTKELVNLLNKEYNND